MDYKTLNMQYGHADGHTSICFSSEGKSILTCGSDGDVRMWSSQEDGDPRSECVGEMAIALAYYGDHFYVGSDTNYVQAYTFPEAKRDGIVSRFTAPVTHIAISQDGSLIAAGSCDMEIQVADTENSNAITKMVGHSAPVTGVSLDPLVKYLASSSCDGSVKVWDVKTGDVIKTLPDVFPRCNDFFRALILGRPSWQSQNGGFLAVPTGKEVTLYVRDSWIAAVRLSDSKVMSSFSLAEFSPCGNYLAAGSTSGEVIVWDVENQVTIASYVHPKKVSINCIAWRADSHALAVCDRLGQFSVVEDVLDGITQAPPSPPPLTDTADFEGGDDNEISIEEIKRSAGWGSQDKMDDASSVSDDGSASFPPPRPPAISVNLQPPFQPSSTPVHFQHRFMVWNAVGIVRCFNTEEEKSIDVEFHDTMFHHVLHINNYEDYKVAALSSKVLALASTTCSDDSPSKLTCVLLNAWDGTKEWVIPMPEAENITAVAAAGGWVAASTDLHHLRLFSYAGAQRQPVAVPGQVVCLVGHEEKLGVIYHQGLGAPDSQNLGVVVYEVHPLFVRTVVPPQPLPLPPKSTLKWAGFSDEGRLCSFDSTGVLRCLGSDMMHWAVLTDTRAQSKGPSDHYFVIGVSERYQNIRCVLCKGSYYPMTTPRPTVVEIPLRLPLCEPEAEKSSLEETFWRLMCSLPAIEAAASTNEEYETEVTDIEKSLKQTVVKLFAMACKGDFDLRAREVASLMPEQPLQMAIKYASKCGKMNLAEKLNEVVPVDWADMRQLSRSHVHTMGAVSETRPSEPHMEPGFSNGYQASQRDIFDDTPAENKLLQAECEDSPLSMTLTPSVKNPFKVKEKAGTGPRGLCFFDKPVPPKTVRNEPIRNPALAKKVGKPTKSNKTTGNNQPKKQTFVQWFATHKQEISQEFPELSLNDLTKKGMARFREESSLQSLSTSDSQELDSQETQLTESTKRKLEDSDVLHSAENVKKVASNKLSMFAFHKNT